MFKITNGIMFFRHHPGFGFVSSNPTLKAELNAYDAYIVAYQLSFPRKPRREHVLLPNVYFSSIGLRQQRALLCRSGFFKLLVHKLMRVQDQVDMRKMVYHARCIFSRRHFLVSKNAAEILFKEGTLLYKEQRYRETVEIWGQAALLGHGLSHALLSTILIEGRKDVLANEVSAQQFASAGVALGCDHSKGALARCILDMPGILYSNRTENPECLVLAKESAQAGSPFGNYILAMCFNYGLGLPKDELEIMRLLKLAADDGHAEAMRAYAHRIVNFGANPDYSKVASLLREAAGQGLALAQCNLGLMFMHGLGFAVDYQTAKEYFQLAAEQENSLGRGLLQMIEKKLSKLRTKGQRFL